MAKYLRIAIVLVLLAAALPAPQGVAAADGQYCAATPSGQICFWVPPDPAWNGDLVVFAHGYVPPSAPLQIPWDQLSIGGTPMPALINSLGYAFGVTSYSKNGLAVKEGVGDVVDLVNAFPGTTGKAQPGHVFIVGASEGGLVATLALEQNPGVFSGGLETCGPIGDFRQQVNYWGDFRVVFDYFFPGLLPPTAVNIPPGLIAAWAVPPGQGGIQDQVAGALALHPELTQQLLRVAKAPIDATNPVSSTGQTVLGLLWYNVNATDEGRAELGGEPFDNSHRWYFGSANDMALNNRVTGVARYTADAAALGEIARFYDTSGRLQRPLVALHTTGDPIVPYWHVPLYRAKTLLAHSMLKFTSIPILRYGHCSFTQAEAVFAFSLLVRQATQQPVSWATVQRALPDHQSQADFQALSQQVNK